MDSFRSVTKKALNFVFLISLPLTVYFILFAKEGIYFLSGKEYTGAIVPMQIIMPTLILIGITNILGIQILVPLGKEKYVLYSEIAGAITDLILNAILIPFFQSSGAAIGTVAAEFAVLLVQFYALKDEVTPMFKAIKYYKIIIALLLGVAASFWVPFLNFNSFVTLVISAVIFFAVYGVALLIMKEQLVNDIFNQVKSKLHI